jgi:hypothetical protein
LSQVASIPGIYLYGTVIATITCERRRTEYKQAERIIGGGCTAYKENNSSLHSNNNKVYAHRRFAKTQEHNKFCEVT